MTSNEMKIQRALYTWAIRLDLGNESRHQTKKNVNIYLISGKFILQLNDKAFLVDWLNQ